jgi:NADPH:quinone reductase-like Zn-dependent oxidoreductase
MRAATNNRYGPPSVVSVQDVPMPVAKAGEVLVRVRAAAVTAADSRLRGARFPRGFALLARLVFGILRPRRSILGSSFSGEVAATIPTGPPIGTPVSGLCGVRMGAHAEYVSVATSRIVAKPDAVSHEDAAGLLFGGTTALFFLRDKAALRSGQTVLVNGASGAVGTAAVQLATHLGGVVTAVTSTPNVDLVRRLGAAKVIDYTTAPLDGLTDRFDVVLDTVGTISPARARSLLAPGGKALLVAADLRENLAARDPVMTGTAPERAADVAYLLDLAAAGHLVTVLDTVGELTDIVALHTRVDSGRKVGNVVVTM